MNILENHINIDYGKDRERFLTAVQSPHTRKAYTMALGHLETWCQEHGLASPFEMDYGQADDFVLDLRGRYAPGTCRLFVSAVSAFYTQAERWHKDVVKNPLRGTKAKPKAKNIRPFAVPSDVEIQLLQEAASGDPVLRAAIAVMTWNGLRVGGLPGLSISGDTWRTITKGAEKVGKIAPEAREAIQEAGLPLRAPFASVTVSKIQDRFRYLSEKLHKTGMLAAVYSVHDLRHAFACRNYMKSRDIYRVSRLIGHETVKTTECYLRNIGIEEIW